METNFPHRGGQHDGGDISPPTPRWWVILWCTWGLVVAGLIIVLDQQLWFAIPWVLAGIVVGRFGLKALQPFQSPFYDWYRSWYPDDGLASRMLTLMDDDNAEPDADMELRMDKLMDDYLESEEYKSRMAEEMYWMSLAIPPLGGLFHGVFIGPLGGALCGIDSDSVSAATGALLGLLVGPVFVAFVVAITSACIVDPGPGLSFRVRLARRGLLFISPLLIVPCVWYCLKRVLQRRGVT